MAIYLTLTEASERHAIPLDAILQAVAEGHLQPCIDQDHLDQWVDTLTISTTPGPYGPFVIRQVGSYLQWQLPVGLSEDQQRELQALLEDTFNTPLAATPSRG